MSDEEETADPTRKSSRRDRFKDRLARTKTKLTKKDKDSATTVDDFLAIGRASTSTGRPSVSDSLSVISDRPPTTQSHYQDAPEAQHTFDHVPPAQPSPRRIVVPKIDVSSSQRYPGAQPLQDGNDQSRSTLLRPDYQSRSQSNSSLAKGRGRARGLSVQFVDRPPIIIGEGGDEAETPTIEVGRAKARARSASPIRGNGPPLAGSKTWNESPMQYLPRPGKQMPQASQPPHPTTSPSAAGSLPSPGIKRVQTGMIGMSPSPISDSRQAMDKEFEMSLGMRSATNTTPSSTTASPIEPPVLHSPMPIRPPVAIPNVQEIPLLHELKSQHGTKNLRNKFDKGEGRVLKNRDQNSDTLPNSESPEEEFAPPPGPPPGREPPVGSSVLPARPPPEQKHPANGNQYQQGLPPYQQGLPPTVGVPRYQSSQPSYPPPPQQASNRLPRGNPPPPRMLPVSKFQPPPHPPPTRRAPDEEYTGWVPDSNTMSAKVAPAVMTSAFPGIDESGKLAPFYDTNDDDAKPEKSKRRWFSRRGS